MTVSSHFESVGELAREEVAEMIVAYSFDLRARQLWIDTVPNPNAGAVHTFRAHRARGTAGDPVALNPSPQADHSGIVDGDSNTDGPHRLKALPLGAQSSGTLTSSSGRSAAAGGTQSKDPGWPAFQIPTRKPVLPSEGST